MNTDQQTVYIYIVASYCGTVPGMLIRARAKFKFWNRYPGDGYSHISLSLDGKLDRMMSFARKRLHNPLAAGLIRENIRTGMFRYAAERCEIAVFRVPVTRRQYEGLRLAMERDWARREHLGYNFLGLLLMLLIARGMTTRDHYFCSQWVAGLLNEQQLYFWGEKDPCQIRPFDFYCALRKYLVYEGRMLEYPLYYSGV